MPDASGTLVGPRRCVLVTGGAGFIGRALATRLAHAGCEVAIMVRTDRDPRLRWIPPWIRVRTANLLDPHTVYNLLDEGFDEVCHLAGRPDVRESFRVPLDYYTNNVQGTVNLLAAMEAASGPGRLLFLSSSSVYDPVAASPVAEHHRLAPACPYGWSKLAAEQVVAAQARTGRLGAVVLRCFNVAGARYGTRDESTNRLVPRLVTLAAGGAGDLVVDPGAIRDLVHVADVVDACVKALAVIRPGAVQTFNVGSGVSTRVMDVVQTLERLTGVRTPVTAGPPEHHPGLVADITAIGRRLAWHPANSTIERIVGDAWLAHAQDHSAQRALPVSSQSSEAAP